MFFNKKGQGALEYLLLIGGAVLIAAIVLAVVTGVTQTGQQGTDKKVNDALCAPLPNLAQCEDVLAGDVDGDGSQDCTWSAGAGRCVSCPLPPAACP